MNRDREEAIKTLENMKKGLYPWYPDEVLDMAIHALQQEPCEDAVSRQALINKAISWDKHFTDSERYVSLTDIQNAPSVTPKPCEDAISRQALKDLGAECIAKRNIRGNLIPLGSIDSLPSVSTEKTDDLETKLKCIEANIHGYAEGLKERTRWIPVSERLPEVNQRVLVTSYSRVCYAMMISADGNSGYPVFKLQDSLNEKVVCETTVHSEFTTSRIKAWMPLPQPYKGESEE